MPLNLPQSDEIRIRHMADAARQASQFSTGRGRADLDLDAMFRRAVTSCIQEIGEAANRVSPQTRTLVTGVPWQQIIGMRNRLVHVYFNVDPDLVWEVIENELQPLLAALELALA